MSSSTIERRQIDRVAVVGSDCMGVGIAQVLTVGGANVVLGDVDAEGAEAARLRLIERDRRFVADGLFDEGAVEILQQRLSAAGSIEGAVVGADYVTEAVFETRKLKEQSLARISAAVPAQAIIATNTSAIPIGELAVVRDRPERFLGVHWMNPAPFIPGVEITPGVQTAPETVDDVEAFIRAAGKVPAQVADTPGFAANRLQFALYKEAVKVVDEGLATRQQVDLVVSNAFGFRLAPFGPFAIGDMAGLDVYAASYESLASVYGDRPRTGIADTVGRGRQPAHQERQRVPRDQPGRFGGPAPIHRQGLLRTQRSAPRTRPTTRVVMPCGEVSGAIGVRLGHKCSPMKDRLQQQPNRLDDGVSQ